MEHRATRLTAALGLALVVAILITIAGGSPDPLGIQPAENPDAGLSNRTDVGPDPEGNVAGSGTQNETGGPSSELWTDRDIPLRELPPVQAGKRLTHGNCEGSGAGTLSHPPMDPADIGVIIPYGLTTGAHVTPIDHWYFSPAEFDSAPDTYPVYAMSDGHVYLLDYSGSNDVEDTGEVPNYGVYISLSCTNLYYETLLTSLSPRLQTVFEEERHGDQASVFVPVEAGERIGWIGGQTIDYAVLDTTHQLDGYVSPELYEVEAAKLFTADPFDYFTPKLRETILEKYPRTSEPLAGKIDYDVEGRLRGNWFIEGTNGYRGGPIDEPPSPDYWKSHLAIYPDHLDPEATIISVGDFAGESQQFATPLDSPNPVTVGVGDGQITYSLADIEYATPNGSRWDGLSPVGPLTVDPGWERGCGLFEMPSAQTLHAEFFPGTPCNEVEGFTQEMRIYER